VQSHRLPVDPVGCAAWQSTLWAPAPLFGHMTTTNYVHFQQKPFALITVPIVLALSAKDLLHRLMHFDYMLVLASAVSWPPIVAHSSFIQMTLASLAQLTCAYSLPPSPESLYWPPLAWLRSMIFADRFMIFNWTLLWGTGYRFVNNTNRLKFSAESQRSAFFFTNIGHLIYN
jgi:hypothetical protein